MAQGYPTEAWRPQKVRRRWACGVWCCYPHPDTLQGVHIAHSGYTAGAMAWALPLRAWL